MIWQASQSMTTAAISAPSRTCRTGWRRPRFTHTRTARPAPSQHTLCCAQAAMAIANCALEPTNADVIIAQQVNKYSLFTVPLLNFTTGRHFRPGVCAWCRGRRAVCGGRAGAPQPPQPAQPGAHLPRARYHASHISVARRQELLHPPLLCLGPGEPRLCCS
jgi:hypothetical protein